MYALIHKTTGEYYQYTNLLGVNITGVTCAMLYFTKESALFNQKLLPEFDLIQIDVIKSKN
jgi:hypothetical protein